MGPDAGTAQVQHQEGVHVDEIGHVMLFCTTRVLLNISYAHQVCKFKVNRTGHLIFVLLIFLIDFGVLSNFGLFNLLNRLNRTCFDLLCLVD